MQIVLCIVRGFFYLHQDSRILGLFFSSNTPGLWSMILARETRSEMNTSHPKNILNASFSLSGGAFPVKAQNI